MLRSQNINSDNIIDVIKLMSNMRNGILDTNQDEKRIRSIESFFHVVSYVSLDNVFKEQAYRWNLHHADIKMLRQVLNFMISNVNEMDQQLYSIVDCLRAMGVNSCLIYTYDEEIKHYLYDKWEPPQELTLKMVFNKNENVRLHDKNIRLSWEDVLNNEYFPKDRRLTLFFNPLFFMDEQLGLILCEFNMNDKFIFESLIIEISCALKLSFLIHNREMIEYKLRDTMRELENYNKKLNNLSQTDDLTGLYNRRGFISLASSSLDLAQRMGKSGLLFFVDMDGLKAINDSFGHEEGDRVIKEIANILRSAFRKADIVARLGGDEFVVFTTDTDINMAEFIKKRIYKLCDEHHLRTQKPYKLSVSMGVVSYQSDSKITIEQLMADADNLLYLNKKIKKTQKTYIDSNIRNNS